MRSMQRVAGFLVGAVVSGALLLGAASLAVADQKGKGHDAHKHFKGEVIEKAGALHIKPQEVITFPRSDIESRSHGRELKVGYKFEVWV
jgi:hypothetical protein